MPPVAAGAEGVGSGLPGAAGSGVVVGVVASSAILALSRGVNTKRAPTALLKWWGPLANQICLVAPSGAVLLLFYAAAGAGVKGYAAVEVPSLSHSGCFARTRLSASLRATPESFAKVSESNRPTSIQIHASDSPAEARTISSSAGLVAAWRSAASASGPG